MDGLVGHDHLVSRMRSVIHVHDVIRCIQFPAVACLIGWGRHGRHDRVLARRPRKDLAGALDADRARAVGFDIAAGNTNIAAAAGQQNFLGCGDCHLAIAGGDFDVLRGGGFDVAALRLYLNRSRRRQQLQADLALDSFHEQADVLRHVMNPAAARGLVGVALRHQVQIGAGGQRLALFGDAGDPGGRRQDQDGLPSRLLAVGVFRGVAAVLPGFQRVRQMLHVPAAGFASRAVIRLDQRRSGLDTVGQLAAGGLPQAFAQAECRIELGLRRIARQVLACGIGLRFGGQKQALRRANRALQVGPQLKPLPPCIGLAAAARMRQVALVELGFAVLAR